MLADPSLDVIDITLPPGLHAEIAIQALRAGKHVFCEKPMALTPRDCDRMAAAAAKANRLLLVGHVLPFYPEYAWAYKIVQGGKYGRLLGGSFRRVISDPNWLPHFWSAEQSGGPMLDLHVHDAHFIRLLFGMPEKVTSGGRLRNDLAEFWHTQFQFSDHPYVVEATSGTINQQGRSFEHGFEIHLERATLAFDFAVFGNEGRMLLEPTLLDDKGRVKRPKLSDGDPMDAFLAELREILRAVRTGKPSPILDGNLARDAIVICQKQTESLRKGRPVKVGAKK
jgi:predicted dehydrogenase